MSDGQADLLPENWSRRIESSVGGCPRGGPAPDARGAADRGAGDQAKFELSEHRACALVASAARPVATGRGGRTGRRCETACGSWRARAAGRLRDECLNEHWFVNLGQARVTIETWRLDYNGVRPHSALGDVPPEEFEQLTRNRATAPILSA